MLHLISKRGHLLCFPEINMFFFKQTVKKQLNLWTLTTMNVLSFKTGAAIDEFKNKIKIIQNN